MICFFFKKKKLVQFSLIMFFFTHVWLSFLFILKNDGLRLKAGCEVVVEWVLWFCILLVQTLFKLFIMLYSGHMIWNHILWEANQIVDRLAKHVLGIDINFYVYIFASDFIVLELRADLAQTCFPRGF